MKPAGGISPEAFFSRGVFLPRRFKKGSGHGRVSARLLRRTFGPTRAAVLIAIPAYSSPASRQSAGSDPISQFGQEDGGVAATGVSGLRNRAAARPVSCSG